MGKIGWQNAGQNIRRNTTEKKTSRQGRPYPDLTNSDTRRNQGGDEAKAVRDTVRHERTGLTRDGGYKYGCRDIGDSRIHWR
jgi:hypothetical protein